MSNTSSLNSDTLGFFDSGTPLASLYIDINGELVMDNKSNSYIVITTQTGDYELPRYSTLDTAIQFPVSTLAGTPILSNQIYTGKYFGRFLVESWTAIEPPNTDSLLDVAWGSGPRLFVASFSSPSTDILTSPDGLNWTMRTGAEANNWHRLAWSPEYKQFLTLSNSTGVNQVLRNFV